MCLNQKKIFFSFLLVFLFSCNSEKNKSIDSDILEQSVADSLRKINQIKEETPIKLNEPNPTIFYYVSFSYTKSYSVLIRDKKVLKGYYDVDKNTKTDDLVIPEIYKTIEEKKQYLTSINEITSLNEDIKYRLLDAAEKEFRESSVFFKKLSNDFEKNEKIILNKREFIKFNSYSEASKSLEKYRIKED